MKVSLNLAVPQSPRERYALAWAAPVTILALAGFIFLVTSAARAYRAYRQVHRDYFKLEEQAKALDQAEKDLRKDLERPPFRGLYRETQFVNTILERKQLSFTALAERVTQLLPPSVHLVSLSFAQPDRERAVRFVVVGKSEEALENFVINLENASDFKDVAIVNQTIEEADVHGGEVRVTCIARYVGAAER
jgi:hypothetical protein